MAFEYILLICSIVCYSVSLLMAVLYCNVGYGGYPDKWENKLSEKVYIAGVIFAIVFCVAALIVAL